MPTLKSKPFKEFQKRFTEQFPPRKINPAPSPVKRDYHKSKITRLPYIPPQDYDPVFDELKNQPLAYPLDSVWEIQHLNAIARIFEGV